MRIPEYRRQRFARATAPTPITPVQQATVQGQIKPYAANALRAQAKANREMAGAFGVAAAAARQGQAQRAQDIRAVDVALGRVSNAAEIIGMDIAKSQATDALTAYSREVDALLYAPDGGFLGQQGINAVSTYKDVSERINKLHDDVVAKLDGPARRFAEQQLEGRRARAMMRAGTHFVGERRSYAIESAEASIAAASEEAFFDPTATDAAIATIGEQVDRIGVENGWSPEKISLEKRSRITSVHAGTVNQLSTQSPSTAMRYLEAHRQDMDPKTVASLQAALIPEVRREVGRNIGREVHNGVTEQAQSALDALQASWGTPLTINSAHRTPEHNRSVGGASDSLHLHGKAFDISIKGWSRQEQLDFVREARAKGFGGIGIYDNHIHIDTGDQRHWGPDHSAASAPGWAMSALAAPVAVVGGSDELMRVDDVVDMHPEIRAAAFSEMELRGSIETSQEKARTEALFDQAMAVVSEGGDWRTLSAVQLKELGPERIAQLERFEKQLTGDGEPDTGSAEYQALFDEVMTAAEAGDYGRVQAELGNLTFAHYEKARAVAKGDVGAGPSRATVMSSADATLRSMGILKTETPRAYRFTQMKVMDWIARNPEATQADLDMAAERFAGDALMEIRIDPSAWPGQELGTLDEIDFEGMSVDEVIRAADRGGLVIAGVALSAEDVEQTRAALLEFNGTPPTSAQIIEALMRRLQ